MVVFGLPSCPLGNRMPEMMPRRVLQQRGRTTPSHATLFHLPELRAIVRNNASDGQALSVVSPAPFKQALAFMLRRCVSLKKSRCMHVSVSVRIHVDVDVYVHSYVEYVDVEVEGEEEGEVALAVEVNVEWGRIAGAHRKRGPAGAPLCGGGRRHPAGPCGRQGGRAAQGAGVGASRAWPRAGGGRAGDGARPGERRQRRPVQLASAGRLGPRCISDRPRIDPRSTPFRPRIDDPTSTPHFDPRWTPNRPPRNRPGSDLNSTPNQAKIGSIPT